MSNLILSFFLFNKWDKNNSVLHHLTNLCGWLTCCNEWYNGFTFISTSFAHYLCGVPFCCIFSSSSFATIQVQKDLFNLAFIHCEKWGRNMRIYLHVRELRGIFFLLNTENAKMWGIFFSWTPRIPKNGDFFSPNTENTKMWGIFFPLNTNNVKMWGILPPPEHK